MPNDSSMSLSSRLKFLHRTANVSNFAIDTISTYDIKLRFTTVYIRTKWECVPKHVHHLCLCCTVCVCILLLCVCVLAVSLPSLTMGRRATECHTNEKWISCSLTTPGSTPLLARPTKDKTEDHIFIYLRVCACVFVELASFNLPITMS